MKVGASGIFPNQAAKKSGVVRHGVARAISRAGVCSRTQAAEYVRLGRVRVDGRRVHDPEFPTTAASRIELDGVRLGEAARAYLMLNKPRGLVTSTVDERGRDTVYRCFEGADLPWIAPVGRLDKASEGLLLFSNDPAWAAAISDPVSGPDKTYHVKINCVPDATTLMALEHGIADQGDVLRAKSARILRNAERSAWLEVVLDEGRNRQIRRLLAAFDIEVLRLLRVAIGELVLGDLAKGAWRALTIEEVKALGSPRQ
ncbi:MAG: pseudouridine synthase [Pseudomarimonas sp.]